VEAERKRERERERGALGAAWSSAARTSGALPRDSEGRRGQRDADGVADRWAET
jgi:hypothetical protein